MSSFFCQKRACAHPVIDPEDHLKSCLPNCDCCRVYPTDIVSSETCDVSLGPKKLTRHKYSKDDIAISSRLFSQVDYLSHHWEEEDIWSSWRYIVTRRGTLLDQVRLENAAWRTWAKVKDSLKTVPPEALNWRKVDDITWLYGPLHLAQCPLGLIQADLHQLPLGKPELRTQAKKRPILKRRSLSQDVSNGSLLAGSLLDQTASGVDIQNARSLYISPLVHSWRLNPSQRASHRPKGQEINNPSQSADSPMTKPPSRELKRTRFNERVQQCVIVDEYVPGHDDNQPDYRRYGSDSDSDDGILMQCTKTKKLPVSQQETSKLLLCKGKGISMLPSTALKAGHNILVHGEVDHRPPVKHFPLQDISPAEESMAIFVRTGRAKDSLQVVGSSPATAGSPLSSKNATGNLHRSNCSNSGFEEGITSSRYEPPEDGRASSSGGVISLLGKAITSIRNISYLVWNSRR